ncbi:hypothetical protein FH972_024844 [Carpinus fangiana]|uniref:Altered inheritance of mitochondria protein 32 n=1 Tax=Carpinus fangiana TaxID=176857 RepID=A0A5N6KZN9_9ROSI|nr:hypothetical protein FH972_024844 [Carpinus fangiana]
MIIAYGVLRRQAPRVWPSKMELRWHTSSSLQLAPSHIPQTIATCPEPTCSCAPTPAFPSGVDPIDTKSQLAGTVAIHNRLVVVGTGPNNSGQNWPSKIEKGATGTGSEVIKQLKTSMGVRGQYFNEWWNAMVVASSFGGGVDNMQTQKRVGQLKEEQPSTTAIIFPQGIRTSPLSPSEVEELLQSHILPTEAELKASLGRRQLPDDDLAKLPKQNTSTTKTLHADPISSIVVFICGHGQRDARCGILGPILKTEFEQKLVQLGVIVTEEPLVAGENSETPVTATVGFISHIGGHKFAGNVVIFVPRNLIGNDLAGKTIWYGRVEPRHVEGIVKTIKEGKVIKELLRGGMDENGMMLRNSDFLVDL